MEKPNETSILRCFVDDYDHIPLSSYLLSRMGKPYPNRSVTLGFPRLTKKNVSKLKTLKLFWLMSAVSGPSPLHLAIPISLVLIG